MQNGANIKILRELLLVKKYVTIGYNNEHISKPKLVKVSPKRFGENTNKSAEDMIHMPISARLFVWYLFERHTSENCPNWSSLNDTCLSGSYQNGIFPPSAVVKSRTLSEKVNFSVDPCALQGILRTRTKRHACVSI